MLDYYEVIEKDKIVYEIGKLQKGDIDYILQNIPNIQKYNLESNCFHRFIEMNDFKSLEKLLKMKLDSNKGLVSAIANNNLKALRLLFKYGADVNYIDGDMSIISWAVYHENISIIEILYVLGADLKYTIYSKQKNVLDEIKEIVLYHEKEDRIERSKYFRNLLWKMDEIYYTENCI
jgi:hypothetical protein